jgi:hypothetical protein
VPFLVFLVYLFLYENSFYANNIVALRYAFFMAFHDPCLWIFIVRCARSGHGGLYENACNHSMMLMIITHAEKGAS